MNAGDTRGKLPWISKIPLKGNGMTAISKKPDGKVGRAGAPWT